MGSAVLFPYLGITLVGLDWEAPYLGITVVGLVWATLYRTQVSEW